VPAEPAIALPPLVPSLVVTRASAGTWQQGRAGMRYCDLIPGRQGGAFIASRIRIDAGGPVPDWVHFHRVHLQLIYCHRGQVRVVYEDQGPPFVLRPGDAVLQPPQIRHRVLECSPGLEVVELSSPAAHETLADHTLELPTAVACPERRFDGQRFVHHVAERACSRPWRHDGFSARDLGVGAATGGLAEASVVRGRVGAATPTAAHGGELYFGFVLAGAVTLRVEGRAAEKLAAGDAFVVPAGLRHALGDASADLEWLEVAVRARTRG
jgi:quercetin dioxygenase-like cupin family protein